RGQPRTSLASYESAALMGTVNGSEVAAGERAWWRSLTRYQWLVFAAASLGWLFDCMDQQLFNLARAPALRELLALPAGGEADAAAAGRAGDATTAVLVGSAVAGVVFGGGGGPPGRAPALRLT